MRKLTRRNFMKGAGALTLGAAISPLAPRMAWSSTPTIKMAYILSDHHAPLMLAASHGEMFEEKYKTWLKPLNPAKLYELYDNGSPIARVQLIPTKKGPDVEKLVAQGSVDIAISGTQAILMSVDKGVDTKIISPLQTAGNVFVLNKDVPAQDWKAFVSHVKGQGKQFKIGMPGPHTVAAIIFRSALEYEGVSYTEDSTDRKADVLFINMKGHGNLVAALNNRISEGIIGAQPFPSVTIDQGVGRLILNLQDVPPAQRWAGHACCSLEAASTFLTQDPALAAKALSLMALGVDLANTRKDLTAKTCSGWLGVSESVETVAMQSMTYTTTATPRWITSVDEYAKTMDGMGMFTGKLKGAQGEALASAAFDFSMMNGVTEQLKAKGLIA
ncbi:NitT/TauT family transport system substrate-binding protein [Desulfatibacillum alkenivorans DSM 16219]|uniref:NitT/TauT family transport system substrate-binding protein n=1 Tax=Desulfatibacillum alkenivorans DSM 16219 TaxID=1121393 RepID=A0A1M6LS72_9BACT|nr:substrate-binding domain-containing protein [Desulfatibacillum alkenivorans]SHJ74108.1 NitT/TauT family transport system substrate-binding protein [Desulfatibacillum alkenivorans DSM 16219]